MKFDYDVVLSGSGPFSAGNCRNYLMGLFAVLPFVPFVSQLFPGNTNRAGLSARCPCGSCPGVSTLSPKDGAPCGLEEEGEEGGPPALRQGGQLLIRCFADGNAGHPSRLPTAFGTDCEMVCQGPAKS